MTTLAERDSVLEARGEGEGKPVPGGFVDGDDEVIQHDRKDRAGL